MIHVTKLQLDFGNFPYQQVHTSGLLGQDSGFLQEDTMTKISHVLPLSKSLVRTVSYGGGVH